MSQFIQFIVSGLTNGSVYALVALGITVIYNATGVMNFAQGQFVVIAGLFAATLSNSHIPIALVVAIAVTATGILGGIIYLVTVGRMARGSTIFSTILVTLGLAIALQAASQIIWGTNPKVLRPFTRGTTFDLGHAFVSRQAIWVWGGTLLTLLVIYLLTYHTRLGDAMLAASDNSAGARLVGVKTSFVGLTAFTFGAMAAAIGGVLITPLASVSYSDGVDFTIKAFAAAVLGGFGSPLGAVAGGVSLGILEALGAGYISSGYQDLFSLVILVLVLLLLPRGIVGSRELEH